MDRRKLLTWLGISALGSGAAMLAGCGSAPPRPEPGAGPAPSPGGGPVVTEAPTGADDPFANSRLEVVMQALGQLGIPYVWGGTSPHIGFDCSGLVTFVYRQAAQLVVPRVTYDQARVSRPIGASGLRPADLVFYNTMRREFSHVGIFIGDERFVHAPAARGVVRIENMRADYWRDRFNGARRLLV